MPFPVASGARTAAILSVAPWGGRLIAFPHPARRYSALHARKDHLPSQDTRTRFGHQAALRWGTRSHLLHHVINDHSLAQALQRYLADLLQLRVLFYLDRDTATDQY